jgi:hypothetical protein
MTTVGRGFSPPARSCRAEARPTELNRRVFHRRAAESAEKKNFLPGVLGVLGGSMVFVFSCKVPSLFAARCREEESGRRPPVVLLSPPLKHPAFVKRFGTAIRPNNNWIAAKANFQLYARLWPTRSGLTFPERLCAGSASSRTFLPKTSPRPDRFAEREKRSSRHMSSGRQESRTRTIRFRVHPHPDFHRARLELRRSRLLGNTEIPGLTPIVLRGRMLSYAPDDCSIVITSVRRSKSKNSSPQRTQRTQR